MFSEEDRGVQPSAVEAEDPMDASPAGEGPAEGPHAEDAEYAEGAGSQDTDGAEPGDRPADDTAKAGDRRAGGPVTT
jgi:hypothetical protein